MEEAVTVTPEAQSLETPTEGAELMGVDERTLQKVDLLVGYEAIGVAAFLVHGLFTEKECNFLIASVQSADEEVQVEVPASFRSEFGNGAIGPIKHTAKGEGHNRKERFLFGSEELATIMWRRMKPFLQDAVGDGIKIFGAGEEETNSLVDPRTGLAQCRINRSSAKLPTVVAQPSACLDMLDLGLTNGEEWLGEWQPAFCNPIFEIMSYPTGGCFRPHLDANLLYMERINELQNEFKEITKQVSDPDRVSSRSLYTIIVYLTGRRNQHDNDPPFAGGETNLLENSYNDKLLYTDDEGNFLENRKRVFASVFPERGAALVFYQKGLLHEGADVTQAIAAPLTQSDLNKKIILRSDVFFRRVDREGDNTGSNAKESCPHVSESDRIYAEKLIAESEEYEEGGDFETAAELYQKAMAILHPN